MSTADDLGPAPFSSGGAPAQPRATRREALRAGLLGLSALALGGAGGAALRRALADLDGGGDGAGASAAGADLSNASGSSAGGPGSSIALPGGASRALLVRGLGPLQLETPRAALATLETPAELFFVRTHAHPPILDLSRYRIVIDGLVERPLALSVADLRQRAAASGAARRAVLQCAGNGRAFFRPRVAGVPWEAGAVGQARWAGPRLADLLREAGVRAGARHLHLRGADTMALPATPAYVRAIPLERALEEDALLALDMNGAPLPWLHGGPARLVLPGWTGNHWVKWLVRATVAAEEPDEFYAKTAYRMPVPPVAPGGTPARTEPVTENEVKAVIARPASGAVVQAGAGGSVEVVGVAFSGRTSVARVDVSGDGGRTWAAAALEGDDTAGAWKLFRARVRADRPGLLAIAARATDARGATQPEATAWNPSGYLWTSIDRVSVEVVA